MPEKEDVRVIQRAAPRRRQRLNADARYPHCPQTRSEVLALAEQARQQRQAFRERLEERQGVQIPAEDPDYAPEGEAGHPPGRSTTVTPSCSRPSPRCARRRRSSGPRTSRLPSDSAIAHTHPAGPWEGGRDGLPSGSARSAGARAHRAMPGLQAPHRPGLSCAPGTGLLIYRACPRCRDIGWAYRDGRNEKARWFASSAAATLGPSITQAGPSSSAPLEHGTAPPGSRFEFGLKRLVRPGRRSAICFSCRTGGSGRDRPIESEPGSERRRSTAESRIL